MIREATSYYTGILLLFVRLLYFSEGVVTRIFKIANWDHEAPSGGREMCQNRPNHPQKFNKREISACTAIF